MAGAGRRSTMRACDHETSSGPSDGSSSAFSELETSFSRCPSQEHLTTSPDSVVQEDSFPDFPPTPSVHPLPEAYHHAEQLRGIFWCPRYRDQEHSRKCLSEESSDHPQDVVMAEADTTTTGDLATIPTFVRWVALRKTRFGPKIDGRTHLTSWIPSPAKSVSQRQLR